MVELEQAVESDADRQVLRQDYVQLRSEKVDMALSKPPDITVSEEGIQYLQYLSTSTIMGILLKSDTREYLSINGTRVSSGLIMTNWKAIN